MNTKIALGMAALALGLVAVKSFTPVLAYRGDATVKSPNYTEERHNINVTAFQKGDYKSWAANMAGKGATRFVNESNFGEFAKAQVASQNGDNTLVNAFRAKYGMGQGSKNGNGEGQGQGMGRNKNQ
ncbi:MAG: hypothetical protein PHR98_04035 [Candidatus Shapirobacteria bacterium]|nr:hypothetical protein [Candidatus Shapirobacteria bacterium]